MENPSADDGAHPDSTPVKEYLESLSKSFQQPPGAEPRLPKLPEDLLAKVMQRLEGSLDGSLVDKIYNEIHYALAHQLAGEIYRSLKAKAQGDSPSMQTRSRDSIPLNELLAGDALALEVGRGLLGLVDPKQGAPLLAKVNELRRHLARELGIALPGVRFRDNLSLPHDGWAIVLHDAYVARGTVSLKKLLVIGPQVKLQQLNVKITVDPTYGMPAAWVDVEQKLKAESLGCMIFDPINVIAAGLTEVVRAHACELVGLDQVQRLLDNLKASSPVLVAEVVPARLTLVEVRAILGNLLRERVSIRDLFTILHTLAEKASVTRDPDILTEFVRVALARIICQPYLQGDRDLWAATLGEELEAALESALAATPEGSQVELEADLVEAVQQAVKARVLGMQEQGLPPVVITPPEIRATVRKLSERSFPELAVVAWSQIPPEVRVHPACQDKLMVRPIGWVGRRRLLAPDPEGGARLIEAVAQAARSLARSTTAEDAVGLLPESLWQWVQSWW